MPWVAAAKCDAEPCLFIAMKRVRIYKAQQDTAQSRKAPRLSNGLFTAPLQWGGENVHRCILGVTDLKVEGGVSSKDRIRRLP